MGLKSVTLQMIPWCFHFSGGASVPSTPRAASDAGIRLIFSDGRVRLYNRSITAAELMREHPLHLVCRSDAFFIGQRVPALGDGDLLLPGHSYLVLPASFFRSVLSFVSLASSLSKASSPIRVFDVRKTETGKLQVRVCDEFLQKILKDEAKEGRRTMVCTTEELEKDYRQLVRCKSKQWRPKLETITEKERRKGVRALRIRRRKKKINSSSNNNKSASSSGS